MFDNFPIWPQRASTMAGNVDALFIFLLIVTGLITLLIFVCLLFFAARFRYRRGVKAEQIEGSTPLELTWSIIPMGVFLAFRGGLRREEHAAHSREAAERGVCSVRVYYREIVRES